MVQQVRPHHEATLLDGTAQSVRYGEPLLDGSGQLDNINSQEVANSHNFIMGSDATEFVNEVNDHVRKRQKRMSNVAGEGKENSFICWMLMVVTMNAATFMGKNFARQSEFHCEHKWDLQCGYDSLGKTLMGISSIDGWRNHHQFSTRESLRLSDSVLCFRRVHQHPKSNESCKDRIGWITTSQSYKNCDGINGESTEVEWNIFPGFDTLQVCDKIKSLLRRLGETPENVTRRILIMSMFNDISWDKKNNEEESLANVYICEEVRFRTMAIYLSRYREEVVFHGRE